jgi:phage terminase small subunit
MAKGEPKTLSKSAEKRAIFVREYLIERNGTRAAIAAGFSAKSAAVTASKLLKNPKVQAELARLHKASCDRLDITLDAVNQELAKLAFVDAGQFLTIDSNGVARLDLKKISDDPDPETGERRPLPRYSAAIQEITEKTWLEGKGENARPVREIKLKLTSAKHAALESLRKHLTGDVDADLTPEQKRDRLNYLLQKAGYVRQNTETNQEQVH